MTDEIDDSLSNAEVKRADRKKIFLQKCFAYQKTRRSLLILPIKLVSPERRRRVVTSEHSAWRPNPVMALVLIMLLLRFVNTSNKESDCNRPR